jgi:putative copper export protein
MLENIAAATKLLLYVAALCGSGTVLAAACLRERVGKIASVVDGVIAWSAAGLVFAAVLNILVLVMRLGNAVSAHMLATVLGTSVGLSLGLQLVGAVLILRLSRGGRIGAALSLIGAGAILASVGVTGHASAESVWGGLVVSVYAGAAAWWMGGLLMLEGACRRLPRAELVGLTRLFSQQAMVTVAVLLGAGIGLIITLLGLSLPGSPSPHMKTLGLKVALAASLLALATYNKVRLTPRLEERKGARECAIALHRSIVLEMVIMSAVLSATAWLTTFHSPHH